MPPKRRGRAQSAGPHAPSNTADKRSSSSAAKGGDAVTVDRKQDTLIFRNVDVERPFTVSRLFKEKLDLPLGKLPSADWSEIRAKIAERTKDSTAWFIRIGEEEVGVDTGAIQGGVERVQFVTIAEASGSTLSPSTFVIREHRIYADDEDYVPEKVRKLEDHGFGWLEVLADDLTSINMFLLVSASDRKELTSKPMSFGFGAAPVASATTSSSVDAAAAAAPAPAAPATFAAGFGSGSNTASAASSGFAAGFGSSSSVPAAPSSSSSAGNSAGFAAGFGAGASASSSASSGFAAGFGAAPQPQPATTASTTSATSENTSATAGSTGFTGWGGAKSFDATASDAASSASAGSSGGFGAAGFGASGGFGNFGTAATTTTTAAPASAETAKPTGQDAAALAPAAAPAKKAEKDTRPVTVRGAPAVSGVPAHAKDVDFIIWSLEAIREMKKNTTQGSRIARRDIPLEDGSTWKKLVMQNDHKDKVKEVVQHSIEKRFAAMNDRMKELGAWRDECPENDPKILEPLDVMYKKVLKEAMKEDEEDYAKLSKYAATLVEELSEIVKARKAEVKSEVDTLDEQRDDIAAHEALPRDKWRVLKYYPKNDVVKFRPHPKARGLTPPGKSVDVCFPPAYVAPSLGGFRKAD